MLLFSTRTFGGWSKLTYSFQRGWFNHQLVLVHGFFKDMYSSVYHVIFIGVFFSRSFHPTESSRTASGMCENLHLEVSHCIFAKGGGPLVLRHIQKNIRDNYTQHIFIYTLLPYIHIVNITSIIFIYCIYICHVFLSPVKQNASPSKTLDDFSRHVWAVARWRAAELSTYVSMVVIGRNGDAKWAPTVPNINIWL